MTTREADRADDGGVAVTGTQARHAERGRESGPDGCRWPTMALSDMTMIDADAAMTADPLFHLRPEGHVGRVEIRHWYFRPELKYLTCRACADAGDPSAIGPEVVGCQHRMRAN
jgi:hypothetical protein